MNDGFDDFDNGSLFTQISWDVNEFEKSFEQAIVENTSKAQHPTQALSLDDSHVVESNFFFDPSIANPSHRRILSSPTMMKPPINHKPILPHSKKEHSDQKVPTFLVDDEERFATICSEQDVTFNPKKLGFIPVKFWPDEEMTFGALVHNFFQKKNNANSRFSHKLFNALRIATADTFYVEFLGVEWLNERVLKVDKKAFARLLGIKTIEGSLFHQQGNFPSHGFYELSTTDARFHVTEEQLKDVDFENVRLFVHQPQIFVKGCKESDIEHCKWIPNRKRI